MGSEARTRVSNQSSSGGFRNSKDREWDMSFVWQTRGSHMNVVVTCRNVVETIGPTQCRTNGGRYNDEANESKVAQVRSVMGSPGWIARQRQVGRMAVAASCEEVASTGTKEVTALCSGGN